MRGTKCAWGKRPSAPFLGASITVPHGIVHHGHLFWPCSDWHLSVSGVKFLMEFNGGSPESSLNSRAKSSVVGQIKANSIDMAPDLKVKPSRKYWWDEQQENVVHIPSDQHLRKCSQYQTSMLTPWLIVPVELVLFFSWRGHYQAILSYSCCGGNEEETNKK